MKEGLANPEAGHGDGVERLPRWNEVAETPEGRDMGGINLKSAANRGVRASRVGGAMHGKQLPSAATNRATMRLDWENLSGRADAGARVEPATAIDERRVHVERAIDGVKPTMLVMSAKSQAQSRCHSARNTVR